MEVQIFTYKPPQVLAGVFGLVVVVLVAGRGRSIGVIAFGYSIERDSCVFGDRE
jgi:hypothetical protein